MLNLIVRTIAKSTFVRSNVLRFLWKFPPLRTYRMQANSYFSMLIGDPLNAAMEPPIWIAWVTCCLELEIDVFLFFLYLQRLQVANFIHFWIIRCSVTSTNDFDLFPLTGYFLILYYNWLVTVAIIVLI